MVRVPKLGNRHKTEGLEIKIGFVLGLELCTHRLSEVLEDGVTDCPLNLNNIWDEWDEEIICYGHKRRILYILGSVFESPVTNGEGVEDFGLSSIQDN